jgi:triosephosphate isomerase
MKKEFLVIANWKMYFTSDQTYAFVQEHIQNLKLLATNRTIILCPSFTALRLVAKEIHSSNIFLGAQDCTPQLETLALTGSVSTQDLKNIGCSYCIIGHSERRTYLHEENELIAKKLLSLLKTHIIPIICIGETEEQKQSGATINILTDQLALIINMLRSQEISTPLNICIAYEPIWAIGTGKIPSLDELKKIFNWLENFLTKQVPNIVWTMIYGGSITSTNCKSLKNIANLNGFLIGGASLDFQELKKIVDCSFSHNEKDETIII